jgi:hypothetical protein
MRDKIIDFAHAQSQIDNLYSYLYNDINRPVIYTQSKDNLDNLFSTYNRRKMISFVGAGPSKPLGIPGWEDLLNRLSAVARDNGFNGKLPKDARMYPEFAQNIYNHFINTKGNAEIYFDIISQNMRHTFNSTSLTLVKMILAFDIHLTTNFDISIENAYKFLEFLFRFYKSYRIKEIQKKYKSYCVPNFEWITQVEKALIYYLHGNVSEDIYILKEDDYKTYYPLVSKSQQSVDSLEIFLKERFKNNNIVFLGFSFSDYYVKEFFFRVAKDIEKENFINSGFYSQSGQTYQPRKIKHFLIVDAKVLNTYGFDIHSFFQEFNIYPVIYKEGKHIFLEELFEVLSQWRQI